MNKIASTLTRNVSRAAKAAANEAQLRHEIEKSLENACKSLSLPWMPYQIEKRVKGRGKTFKFIDVAHGAVIIEYEAPNSFKGAVGSKLNHARSQAEEYAQLLSAEEGRPIGEYVLVAWDGDTINFGRFESHVPVWDVPVGFDDNSSIRLLDEIAKNGVPLVHPKLLSDVAGPNSEFGIKLIPKFFKAIQSSSGSSRTSKTKLLYLEWKRLFGQVIGDQPDDLKRLLAEQSALHGVEYSNDVSAYLYALNTYIALLAKLIAALALPKASQNVLDASVPLPDRIRALESGEMFEHAGITNMLNGDFFSWYSDDKSWHKFESPIGAMISKLSGISFDVTKKSVDSTRDLFKGIYETFVPRALRHALGEYYTPDWLAEHGLDTLGWKTKDDLLDPTCGSGTFILEGLRRRLLNGHKRSAQALLEGLYGIDLNPLAVLSAKGSLAVFISPYLDPNNPIRIPVYLADAINPATKDNNGIYSHDILTEIGQKRFAVHDLLIQRSDFFAIFNRIRLLIDDNKDAGEILSRVVREYGLGDESQALRETIETLCELHSRGWNGIWCPIIADRFAAGAIKPVKYICGNPPWVKWSHLPREYANFIKPFCQAMGVFSSDRWVGGIESDISTVITFKAIENYLSDKGKLGFFINGTVFINESSEGFRRFSIEDKGIKCALRLIEDFDQISPFDGVSNNPVFFIVQRGATTRFPVPFRKWEAKAPNGKRISRFPNAKTFKATATKETLLIQPIPGGDGSRPWLVGSQMDQALFGKVFNEGETVYRARKGVTTDRNGIFWVRVLGKSRNGKVEIENAPEIGRIKGIPKVRGHVEEEHVFPLLRGRDVLPFRASPGDLRIIVPQRGMHGDPELPETHIETYKFLRKFKSKLEARSSFKRFQARGGHPFYSLWSTGSYTFAPYKVLWREMGGGEFAVAYIGNYNDPLLGEKMVIPDHKLYFIPVRSEAEAAYLTGLLNAPITTSAVSAYASQLSLGVSVAEYLHLPQYSASNPVHKRLASLAKRITKNGRGPNEKDLLKLDAIAHQIFDKK